MNRAVSWFCKICIAPIVRRAFIKEVKGWENLPEKNFILSTNHQSHLDEIANGYICVPRRFHFIGQTDNYGGLAKVLLHIIYFVGGVIRLNRKDETSKEEAVGQAIDFLKDGDSLIIYPEGTRTRSGKMGRGKWGVAKIFLETGKPVVPAAISGTFELLPPGGKLKIERIIRINIGKPLYFEEEFTESKNDKMDAERKKELLVKITNKVMQEISSLKAELDQKK